MAAAILAQTTHKLYSRTVLKGNSQTLEKSLAGLSLEHRTRFDGRQLQPLAQESGEIP